MSRVYTLVVRWLRVQLSNNSVYYCEDLISRSGRSCSQQMELEELWQVSDPPVCSSPLVTVSVKHRDTYTF